MVGLAGSGQPPIAMSLVKRVLMWYSLAEGHLNAAT